MRSAVWLALAIGLPLMGGNTTEDAAAADSANVNARYIVESVNVVGVENRAISATLSSSLRAQLRQVVGSNLDSTKLDRLASRLKNELRATRVKVRVTRGTMPDHVLVKFEVARKPVDLKVAKFLYDTEQGWSGEGSATTHAGGNSFTLALASDGDELLERYAGFRVRYDRDSIGTDRVAFGFEFDDFHEMWNPSTVAEDPTGTYRTRQVFTPEARVTIIGPLEFDFGVSFARYRPSTPGAETESSNAVVSTLRYHQRWGSADDLQDQDLDASYSIDAATRIFSTDADFTRHTAKAHYKFRRDRSRIELAFLAGGIQGQAPLFDRFVLGNAGLLRGWNRFDLDPTGGSHVIYGSVEYTYRWYQVFYDTGAVWDIAQEREQRQSVGVGFKKEGFQLAVAYPLHAAHALPIFFAGMNF
jgi:D-alanyl-D-alanine dipeptidase